MLVSVSTAGPSAYDRDDIVSEPTALLKRETVRLIGVCVSMRPASPVKSIELQKVTKSLFTASAQNNKAGLRDKVHANSSLLLKPTVR